MAVITIMMMIHTYMYSDAADLTPSPLLKNDKVTIILRMVVTKYLVPNKVFHLILFSRTVKVSVWSPDIHDNACSADFAPSLAMWVPLQPAIAAVDPTSNLCTRNPLWLGGWGSVEFKICLILQHVADTGNLTPDLFILSSMPYPLDHVLP